MPRRSALSAQGMDTALIKEPSLGRFTGIECISERIPGETVILICRHLPEKVNLGKPIDG